MEAEEAVTFDTTGVVVAGQSVANGTDDHWELPVPQIFLTKA
jgi:hypothetical protein